MTPENLQEFGLYWTACWEQWVARRGYDLPEASHSDHWLIKGLYEQGIPLRIVLRGIEDCGGNRKASSLTYAKPAIIAEINRWAKSQTF